MAYPPNPANLAVRPVAPTPSSRRVAPRRGWHSVALLTALIALAHLLALGLAPARLENTVTPLSGTFSTRTIVLAPPPVTAPKPPAPARQTPPPTPEPKAKPRAAPRPTPAPEPSPTTEASTPAPQPLPDAPSVSTAPAATTSAPAGAAPDPAAGANATALATTSTAAPEAAPAPSTGTPENIGTGTRDMKIPGSLELSFVANVQLSATPYVGTATLVWLQNGTEYEAELSVRALVKLLTQHSSGKVGNDGLAPDRYTDQRAFKSELASHFVREQRQIIFSNNKPSVALQPGAQDRLSVMLQLGALLAGDASRYPPGSTITVQTAGNSDADNWTFNVEDDESLTLPAGAYQTRKLSRAPRREFDDKVELWLAPAIDYLPVRLRVTQSKGDVYDIKLRATSAASKN